jgi:antitoxin MazE
MRTKLVEIGNSRGIRIPKALIEQCGLGGEIELEPREGELIVRSPKTPRAGWEAAFAAMGKRGDDRLLDERSVSQLTEWEREEWQW